MRKIPVRREFVAARLGGSGVGEIAAAGKPDCYKGQHLRTNPARRQPVGAGLLANAVGQLQTFV
ncbi:MAG: hypothetical protein ACRER8_09315 [Pseudomonas sp.]|uniref:hypothetical protein n=1 Tax=Pseudomonas sp. TaxID=306 RepID=UPI003D6E96F2